ncbi:MAG: hypothetical protein JNL35_03130 [Sphingopyxis sp.]|nr:hypothetical protein [Sphingopyxis sp.]
MGMARSSGEGGGEFDADAAGHGADEVVRRRPFADRFGIEFDLRAPGDQPPALPVHLLFEPSRAALPSVRLFVDAMKARLRIAGLG